jgi:hypothetical protein
MSQIERFRRFYPTTPTREYRLRRGVTLASAALAAGLPANRASLIERFPERARPGELDLLRAAVDRAASESDDARGEGGGR